MSENILSENEFVKYWKCQMILKYFDENHCTYCRYRAFCWVEEIMYSRKAIESLCRHGLMKKAVAELGELSIQPYEPSNEKQRELYELAKRQAVDTLRRYGYVEVVL